MPQRKRQRRRRTEIASPEEAPQTSEHLPTGILVVFPYEPQLTLRSHRERRDYILAPRTHLATLCRKYDVPCLDLYPPFEEAYDCGERLYRDGIHLNPAGHRLTAAELLRFLDDRRLLPPAAAGSAAPLADQLQVRG